MNQAGKMGCALRGFGRRGFLAGWLLCFGFGLKLKMEVVGVGDEGWGRLGI